MVSKASRPRGAARVSPKSSQAAVGGFSVWEIANPLLKLCLSVPWDQLGEQRRPSQARLAAPKTEAPPVRRPPPSPAALPTRSGGPGCIAADTAGMALYHLDGLGYQGKTNFGVLRITKERLEEAARAAEVAGDARIAGEYRAIAQGLPEIHDAGKAREAAERLRPVAFRAWELGATCKGTLSSERMGKARALARQVQDGTMTMDEAIKQVRGA